MSAKQQIINEALYSQKGIHTVLHQSIKYELDKTLLNWSLIACIKIKLWINDTYYESKNKRLKTLANTINRKGLDSVVVPLAAAVLHTTITQSLQQAVGYLQAFLPHENAFDRAITAAELLALCSRHRGLYEIIPGEDGKHTTVQVNHWDLMHRKLLGAFGWINGTTFNPPLVAPPLEVTDNTSCGYHTIKEPLILGQLTQHELPQNYDTINTLNKIEWVLDEQVLSEPELPGKPFDTVQQQLNFSQMVIESQFIYNLLGSNPFWLCWQYDSRGRIYSHGYHVNLQSAEYKKALLSFNRKEYLT